MALVKYGGGIIQMSGSIAGSVHARNHYGNYVRARTKPINPQSALQTEVRSAFGFIADRWAQTLTANQRTAWNLYGASVAMKNHLGETTYMTGYNHYFRANTLIKRVYPSTLMVDDGPVIFELPAIDPTLAVTASEATQQLTITYDNTMDWANEDPAWIWFFQGQPQNAQRNYFNGPWRKIGQVVGIIGGGTVTPHVADAVYAISEGQKQVIYARITRKDGRCSEVFRAECSIDA